MKISESKSMRQIGKVVSIASGKGGVGKTLTTINLALAARELGFSVLIIDGDLGLSNVNIVLGLEARYSIYDVLEDRVSLDDIVLTGPLGIKVIPSGSGITKIGSFGYLQKLQMLERFESIKEDYDIIIIDTGAGISPAVLHMNSLAQEVLVVTTPEPHAMTDAYAFIKVMREEKGRNHFGLLANMVKSQDEGLKVVQRITDVSKRFLDAEIRNMGSVPRDPQVQQFLTSGRHLMDKAGHTISGQAWRGVARKLFEDVGISGKLTSHQGFWQDFMLNQQREAVGI